MNEINEQISSLKEMRPTQTKQKETLSKESHQLYDNW